MGIAKQSNNNNSNKRSNSRQQKLVKKKVRNAQQENTPLLSKERASVSLIPLVECGSGCAPRTNIEKSIPFTCLPENRPQVTKMYQDKVKRGEVLPELRSMDTSFSAKMEVPVSC